MHKYTKPSAQRQSPKSPLFRSPIPFMRGTPDYVREHKLRQSYGMSVEGFNLLYDQQRGLCAICRRPITRQRIKGQPQAHVDHCHKTYRVRGLVCQSCNWFLGHFERFQNLLPHIIAYLFNGEGKA